jgi:predicted dehydrogenase
MALRATPGCRLLGVADLDRARAERIAAGARAFSDYHDLLASAEVEAVVVSTPPPSHQEIVTAALAAGKHVLCEKPLAPTPDAARRMVEAARRAGKLLTTGFNHRFFPAVRFLKQALDSGRLGKLDHVRAFAGHEGLSQFPAPWMYDKEVIGGGALMDVGIHVIDLARYVLGEVSQVYGVASSRVWGLPAEDNGIAILRSPAGVPAALHATWSEWKGYRFYLEAYGDRGMARAYYAPMFAMAVWSDRPGGPRRREYRFYPEILVREKFRGWQTTTSRAFQEELRDFLRLAAGDGRVALADGFAGLRAVEIAHAVYRSTASGQAITLG